MLSREHFAAQYLRMSTDMQQYSLENQASAIALYAARRGLSIIRTYEDAGRSGLTVGKRFGLQELLKDIISGQVGFSVILVYDVSRWGRFQDSDESAHYEFLCKQAGVRIEYCAEEFTNDGSITASLLKTMKRAMAGEFSRDLSKRVFAGQARLAAKGYHIGSMPGYGLRRYLIDAAGNPKCELSKGEYKNTHVERVILVPGPIEEVKAVRRIYELFVAENFAMKQIAGWLNAQKIPYLEGRKWTDWAIRDVLSNEKYIGTSVYARTSKKLGTNYRRNPSTTWIRASAAFQPLVTDQQFSNAQRRLHAIALRYVHTENHMLDALSALWCKRGRLTNILIDEDKFCPTTFTYKNRFGSLANAYDRIRYRNTRRTGVHLRLRRSICTAIQSEVTKRGGRVELLAGSCRMLINGELIVSIAIGVTPRGVNYNWFQFTYSGRRRPDLLLVARIAENDMIFDYYALPFPFLTRTRYVTAGGRAYRRLDSFRLESLDPFYELCSRAVPGGSHDTTTRDDQA